MYKFAENDIKKYEMNNNCIHHNSFDYRSKRFKLADISWVNKA